MESLVFEAPGRIAYRTDLPDPILEQPTDVVVRVRLAGLCGSDLHPYRGRERVRPGVIPGHEVVGEVVATGSDVRTLETGDRVVVPFTTSCGSCGPCRRGVTARCERGELFGFGDPDHLDAPALHGGQATLVRVPLAATTAVRLDADVDDATALLLTDNLPTGWEAVQRTSPIRGEPLVVVGLGSVGLCAVAAARAAGADPVIGVDPVAGRRAAAERLGATSTLTSDVEVVRDRLAGRAGAVVEAAGAAEAQRLAFELVRPGGTLSVIAVQADERFPFTPVEAYDTNVAVRLGRASVRATLPTVLAALRDGSLTPEVSGVLTHDAVPLRDGPQLYRRFADREDGLIKAAFTPRM